MSLQQGRVLCNAMTSSLRGAPSSYPASLAFNMYLAQKHDFWSHILAKFSRSAQSLGSLKKCTFPSNVMYQACACGSTSISLGFKHMLMLRNMCLAFICMLSLNTCMCEGSGISLEQVSPEISNCGQQWSSKSRFLISKTHH